MSNFFAKKATLYIITHTLQFTNLNSVSGGSLSISQRASLRWTFVTQTDSVPAMLCIPPLDHSHVATQAHVPPSTPLCASIPTSGEVVTGDSVGLFLIKRHMWLPPYPNRTLKADSLARLRGQPDWGASPLQLSFASLTPGLRPQDSKAQAGFSRVAEHPPGAGEGLPNAFRGTPETPPPPLGWVNFRLAGRGAPPSSETRRWPPGTR